MGAITSKQYRLYKEVKRRDYADQRIPVGMPEALWEARLVQQQLDAVMSHAAWAARRVAYWVETHARLDARSQRPGVVAWVKFEPISADQFLANDELMAARLKEFAVAEALIPASIRLARQLVETSRKSSGEQARAL